MKKIELTEKRYNNLIGAYDWIEFEKREDAWLRNSGKYRDRPAYNISGTYRGFTITYQQRNPSGMGEPFLHLFLDNRIFYFKGATFSNNEMIKESVDTFIDYVRKYENCVNIRLLLKVYRKGKYKSFPHIIVKTKKLIEQHNRGMYVTQ